MSKDTEDYDVTIMGIFKQATAAGMSPNEFWETEPADSVQYVEAKAELNRRNLYEQSLLTAQFFSITLANGFRSSGTPAMDYPKFEDVFTLYKKEPQYDGKKALDTRVAELQLMLAQRAGGTLINGNNS